MISLRVKQCGWEEISVPSIIQQLILVVWGRLLTSAFGVFSVWMNIVRTAPAGVCGCNSGFNFDKPTRSLTRVLEAVRVVRVIY